jgi:ABC-2 type transport system permease protein
MRAILYIAGKDLLLRWRDRLGFFWWMVGFPLLIAVLIGTIFSGALEGPTKPMKAGIVDLANTEASREYIEVLGKIGSVQLEPLSMEAAQDAVRRGRLPAYAVLREGFHLSPALLMGKPLPIAVGVDPTRRAELAYLQAGLTEASLEYLRREWVDVKRRPVLIEDWLVDTGRGKTLGATQRQTIATAINNLDMYLNPVPTTRSAQSLARSINFELLPMQASKSRPRSAFEICFPIGIIWGLLGLAAEFAIGMVQERQAGTLLRLRVAPIYRWQIMSGNALAAYIASVAEMLFLLSVGKGLFGIRLQNPAVVCAAILCIAFCFTGLTMFLSVIGRTESAVGGGAWALLLVLAMIGGGMVPQMFMPHWMDALSDWSPVKWAILGLEGGVWRDFSLHDALLPCLILLGQGLVAGLVGFGIMSRARQ